jgi:hypothetical protein
VPSWHGATLSPKSTRRDGRPGATAAYVISWN